MKVQELIAKVGKLNHNEVSELLHELEKIQVIHASKEAAKRWEGIETLEWGALPMAK
jgi:hypothetical protein